MNYLRGFDPARIDEAVCHNYEDGTPLVTPQYVASIADAVHA